MGGTAVTDRRARPPLTGMKTTTILHGALTAALLCMGCDLIDLGDDHDDDDDDAAETGTGDDGASDGANDGANDDGGAQDGGSSPNSSGADESSGGDGAGDGADAGADEAGSSGPAGESSGGEACEPDTQVCVDDVTIAVCVDGEAILLDCNDACIEIGATGALGCFFDEESGVDVCFCDDGSGGSGGA
jgi:hypothetical protein